MMKTIMVASLNWGLGHATRCIPIINTLLDHDFNVLIASDGESLELLKKEFPTLESLELPSYNIQYPSSGSFFKLKMIAALPKFYRTMAAEKKMVREWCGKNLIDGIISDNRFGVRTMGIPCVYITHQLNVLSGSTTYFSSWLHQRIIKKFDVCWVPDVNDATLNHSGKMGHIDKSAFPIKYFGIMSRMKKKPKPKQIDILAVISGPEPQRSQFEKILIRELQGSDKTILLIQGVVEEKQTWTKQGNISLVNFMQSEELSNYINQSEVVISRSGYSSIMDLSLMEKKAFFVPTPGQYEQEYLARRLKNLGIAPFCKQNKFKLSRLNEVRVYRGLRPYLHPQEDLASLFTLFQSK